MQIPSPGSQYHANGHAWPWSGEAALQSTGSSTSCASSLASLAQPLALVLPLTWVFKVPSRAQLGDQLTHGC